MGAPAGIRVSVVIPTRNRIALLQEAIEAIWSQAFDPEKYEIIVVDNLSTDETPQIVEKLSRESPCRLRYHCMDVNLGPANSRNKGVELAQGELIAFTDSDCRPGPGWLAAGAEAFQDPQVGLVSGRVLYKPEQRVTFFSRATGEATDEHPTYPTANAWYRRQAFRELDGFNVNLCFRDFRNRPVECADTDLAWRVKEAGYKNVFVPEMVVYHEIETLPPLNWALEPFRLFVVPELVRRHPRLRDTLLWRRLFFFRVNALFYLSVLGMVLGIGVHWAFVLLAVPFVFWAGTAGSRWRTLSGLLKFVPRAALLTARQAAMCAGLLYGSLRFRSLVL